MNGHDLLDAAGGIRPEFVNTTERKQRRIRLVYQWAAAAACLCLIAAAVILIPRIKSGHRDDTKDQPGNPAYASAEGLAENGVEEMVNSDEGGVEEAAVNDSGNDEAVAVSDGDYPAMLMVNGILYKVTYVPYEEEIDEAEVLKVTGYAEDGVPVQEGEQNFDRTSVSSYIIIDDDNIAVRMGLEEGWIIFRAETEGEGDVPADFLDPGYGADGPGAEDQDAAADGYAEARIYAPELLDLQNRISADMGPDHRLSFVTASMILEDPDRLHVIVNTQDDELIKLLESYNSGNVLLEIEYSSQSGIEE